MNSILKIKIHDMISELTTLSFLVKVSFNLIHACLGEFLKKWEMATPLMILDDSLILKDYYKKNVTHYPYLSKIKIPLTPSCS